ncbi:unnamed protein product [Owenia fusiformis]|uniref:Uncharacterized protein n=1 Tax=Owenia fusiformis TaxID=6347 RepID=A0A8J1TU65_OWEFU|nr:unnamed protein product [Owenia fusiformis]
MENVTEVTQDEGPPINYTDSEAAVIGVVLTLIALATVFGNLLVVVAVCTTQALKTMTGYFIVSLACADIAVAILVVPWNIYQLVTNLNWPFGTVFCRLFISFDIMFTSASIYNLLCISIDRYIAISKPFQYQQMITQRTVIFMIAACWLMPIFISFVAIFAGWNLGELKDKHEELTASGACVFLYSLPFSIASSMFSFFIPSCIMIVLYTKIFLIARRQVRQIQSVEVVIDELKKQQTKTMKRETKAVKTLVIIMGSFLICWSPFFITYVADAIIGYQIAFIPWTIISWMGWINSTVNPWLYYASNSHFKRAYTRILMCGRSNNNVIDIDYSGTRQS